MFVKVLFCHYQECQWKEVLEIYSSIFPPGIEEKALTFKRWQDRQAFVFGRLLLWKGLKSFGYPDNCLEALYFNKFGKPFIDGPIFFNISHSGNIIVCAFSLEEIGIDVEKIKDINVHEYESIFTEGENAYLANSQNKKKDFYRLWTIKESISKREGKGISILLRNINALEAIQKNSNEKKWYVKELYLHQDYCCFLAMNKNLVPHIVIEEFRISKTTVFKKNYTK